MKKIAIYCRVSTEIQMNEKTIESQIAELENYCKNNQLVIVGKYADNGYSGEILARPDLDRLRDDAKSKSFEAVLIHSVDRLSRNHIHAGLVIEELQKGGLEVIFLNTPPTGTPEGRLLFDIQSVVAQYEKEKIKERTRRGRIHKAKKGIIVGNSAPYGYRYVKGDKGSSYKVNEEEAKVVKLIFDLYVNKSLSTRGVSRELYQRGVKPSKGGIRWATSSLNRVLMNESYTGTTYYHKTLCYEPVKPKSDVYKRIKNTGRKLRPKEEWIPIQITPIIDLAIFEQAQRRRSLNLKFSQRNSHHSYLLSGLLVHGSCGYRMHAYFTRNRNPYYRCSERIINFPVQSGCKGQIRVDTLDSLVWNSLSDVICHPAPLVSYLRKIRDGYQKRLNVTKKEMATVDSSLNELTNRESLLSKDYASGLLSTDQVATLMNGTEQRRKTLLDERAVLEEKLKENNSPSDEPIQIKRSLAKLSKLLKDISFEKKREILKLIVDKIFLYEDKAVVNLNLISPQKMLENNRVGEFASLTF